MYVTTTPVYQQNAVTWHVALGLHAKDGLAGGVVSCAQLPARWELQVSEPPFLEFTALAASRVSSWAGFKFSCTHIATHTIEMTDKGYEATHATRDGGSRLVMTLSGLAPNLRVAMTRQDGARGACTRGACGEGT